MQFRYIVEGEGAALPIHDDPVHIGTHSVKAGVAVYFQIDQKRCFFAYMDAKSPETWPGDLVTEEAGEEIVRQVKSRLRGFLQVYRWEIRGKEFGKNLILQHPCLNDREEYNGRMFQRAGSYVVRAIQEFFAARSQALADEANRRREEAASPRSTSRDDYDQQTTSLFEKSVELKRTGDSVEVDVHHHILLVAPDTGQTLTHGRICYPPGEAKKNHLEEHIPVPRPQRKSICRFGPLKDDRGSFPTGWLATYEDNAEIIKCNKLALAQSESFWRETWDATSKRVSEHLTEADSGDSSGGV